MGSILLLVACSDFIYLRNYKINEIKATCHPTLPVLYLQPKRMRVTLALRDDALAVGKCLFSHFNIIVP